MKICFISDTHSYLDRVKIPKADVLVHCGDLTSRADYMEVTKLKYDFLNILNSGVIDDIVYIAGNHDRMFENRPEEAQKIMEHSRIHYLKESEIVLNGVKFWGSPYTPEFFDWFFMYERDKGARRYWADIPHDTDVLITHGPPHGILDDVKPFRQYSDPHAGCPYLMEKVKEIKPKVHAFGHIHQHHGILQWKHPEIMFINASTCDEAYRAVNAPISVEFNTETKAVEVLYEQ